MRTFVELTRKRYCGWDFQYSTFVFVRKCDTKYSYSEYIEYIQTGDYIGIKSELNWSEKKADARM